MSNPIGISAPTPLGYTGLKNSATPIRSFTRRPLSTDTDFPVGQEVILSKNPSTGIQGELWYLAYFTSPDFAVWKRLDTPSPENSVGFFATSISNINVTGDNTIYNFGIPQGILNIQTNQGNALSATGVFTAPFADFYSFSGSMAFSNWDPGTVSCWSMLNVNSGTTYYEGSHVITVYGYVGLPISANLFLNAGDTVQLCGVVNGTTKTAQLSGASSSPFYTWFSGARLNVYSS